MKVLVDTMNLVFISFNVSKSNVLKEKGEYTEKDINFFYHLFLNKINDLFKDYGNIVFCTEGRGSLDWRREIYPPYKRNRDDSKKDETYLLIKNEFDNIENLLKLYPSKVISVEGAEADDTIYSLATHFADLGEDVLVVSSDGDLTQLSLFNDKIKVFNPIKREMVSPKKDIIKFKAIVGDPSDGISGLYRIGKKTFEKMMLDESFYNEKMSGREEEYKKLLSIVDLRLAPPEIHKKAIETFNSTEWNEFSPKDIEYIMYERGLTQHLTYWWENTSLIYEAIDGTISRDDSSIDFDIDLDNLLETLKEDNF